MLDDRYTSDCAYLRLREFSPPLKSSTTLCKLASSEQLQVWPLHSTQNLWMERKVRLMVKVDFEAASKKAASAGKSSTPVRFRKVQRDVH